MSGIAVTDPLKLEFLAADDRTHHFSSGGCQRFRFVNFRRKYPANVIEMVKDFPAGLIGTQPSPWNLGVERGSPSDCRNKAGTRCIYDLTISGPRRKAQIRHRKYELYGITDNDVEEDGPNRKGHQAAPQQGGDGSIAILGLWDQRGC